MIQTKGAQGGLRLDAHKERSTAQPLRPASVPDRLVLPLDQHAGAAAVPVIAIGDRVLLGQPIARPAADISAWLHSPVSGTVIAIEPRSVPQHLGAPALSIVIENDGRDERMPMTSMPADFASLEPSALGEHIGRGGIVGLGGAAFPTAAKLSARGAAGQHRLLLNGAECEPYISCDDMLMRERAQDVVLGARILLHALSADSCTIAIEDDTPRAAQALRNAIAESHDARIQVAIVPSIYPAGGERQLIAAVFGVEVPFDGLPSDIGLLCQNVGTAAAIARWIRDGEPLISRIVTVTGDGVSAARNLEVRLGTPVSGLIADCGGYTPRMLRLIMGGTMMGLPLPHDDLPVIKATNCVIAASALDLQPPGPEMPCIRCGNCAEVCPAILLPQQLHWYARMMDVEALQRYGLMDCIECGCCDYVCPSQIPLVERFREAKPLFARKLAAGDRAAATRSRFEARETRLERLEAQQRETLAQKRKSFSDNRS